MLFTSQISVFNNKKYMYLSWESFDIIKLSEENFYLNNANNFQLFLLKEPQTISIYWLYILHNYVLLSTKPK